MNTYVAPSASLLPTSKVPFAMVERHAQGFPRLESVFTVMGMTSGATAASADLDSLYRDLRAAHLHLLWRIERNKSRRRARVRSPCPPGHLTQLPEDVIFAGTPPGVDPIGPGDSLRAWISRLGEME